MISGLGQIDDAGDVVVIVDENVGALQTDAAGAVRAENGVVDRTGGAADRAERCHWRQVHQLAGTIDCQQRRLGDLRQRQLAAMLVDGRAANRPAHLAGELLHQIASRLRSLSMVAA